MNIAKNVHIQLIVGARPQFIKAAALCRALDEAPNMPYSIIHTGQHFDDDMSSVFFKELGIPNPVINLGVHSLSHSRMTAEMMIQLDSYFEKTNPDMVVVFGDTNSTLAGALSAAKRHIPVAHVEAGLRSFNSQMPEELNRVLTDHASRLLFCPSDDALSHLNREGVTSKAGTHVSIVGDIMMDVYRYYAAKAPTTYGFDCPSSFYLATIHRSENTDNLDRLASIMNGLSELAESIPVLLPLHPRTKAAIARFGISTKGIRLLDPVSYLTMVGLLRDSSLVLTDSGGLQKEAYFSETPCVVLREETEWTELLNTGACELSGSDCNKIVGASKRLLSKTHLFPPLYGAGDAARKISYEMKRALL